MMKIHEEDQYNDCYGRERMYLALQQRKDAGKTDIDIPCETTVRKVMVQIGLIHKPRRKPNGITKADRLAQKSEDRKSTRLNSSHKVQTRMPSSA